VRTVVLLIASNLFMTAAWYGHLKFKSTHLVLVILVSWMIALPEYVLQVPANRFGHGRFTAAQLKIIQEIVSLSIFLVFSLTYLREAPTWRELAAMALIVAAVALAFPPEQKPDTSMTHEQSAAYWPR
jgi:hypothetical protein